MKRSLDFLVRSAALATALTVGSVAMPRDAEAEQASSAHVVLTPELTAGVVHQFAGMDLPPTCTYTAVPAGPGAEHQGVWAAGMVHEDALVPAEQLRHDDEVRSELITDTNLLYLLGSLVCRTQQQDGSILYVPGHSYDVWGIQGLDQGIVPAPSVQGVTFENTPQHILDGLGVTSTTRMLPYTPDHFERFHYRVIEYAMVSNLIGNARGTGGLNNDEVARLVLSNMHQGEGIPSLDQIFVARYNPYEHGSSRVLSFAPNGGTGIWDVMVYDNNDTNPVIGRGNGLRMGHIANGSQIIDLPGPGRLVHPMIEGLDNPILVYNPETRRQETFTGGVFVIPRDLYGAPVQQVSVAPTGNPLVPQCSDGLDNDGDGRRDMDDPDCECPQDNNEANPAGTTPVVAEVPVRVPVTTVPPTPPVPVVPQQPDEIDPVIVPPVPSPDEIDPVIVPPVPSPDGQHRFLIGAGYLGFGSNGPLHYEMNSGVLAQFGGRLGDTNAYLVGQLGYVFGGSQNVRDPNSRTTLGNPEDPFSLTSVVEAYDRSTAHMIMPGLEFRYRVAPWIQLAAGIIVPMTIYDQERSVDEVLQYQDGSTADEEHYSDRSLETSVMGGACAGVDFVINDSVSVDLRGCVAGNEEDIIYGGNAGLTFYFGGGNNVDEMDE